MKRLLLGIICVSMTLSGWAADNDLAVGTWYLPKTKGSLGSSETVRFAVTNLGTVEVSGFTVAFSVDGGANFTEETFATSVPAGQTRTHTFAAKADLSIDGGIYNMVGKIIHASDPDLSNNEISVTVENRIPGDMCDEPIVTGLQYGIPYTDSRDMGYFNNDYGYNSGFTAPNYLSDNEVFYSFQTSSPYSYVDASVHSNWSGNFNPGIALHVITGCPEGSFSTVSSGYATGTLDAAFTNGYLYAASTYYVVVSQRYGYDATYNLTVNIYEQTDFKTFGLTLPNTQATIDYANHIVEVTVPQGTDVSSLVPTFTIPNYAEAKIGATNQSSGIDAVDFTSPVTYTIAQTIGPKTTQEWTVRVAEDVSNGISTLSIDDVTVSPNPVADEFSVIINDGNNELIKLSIFNSTGNLVLSKEYMSSSHISISAGHLPKGIYLIAIETQKGNVVKKIVKK